MFLAYRLPYGIPSMTTHGLQDKLLKHEAGGSADLL